MTSLATLLALLSTLNRLLAFVATHPSLPPAFKTNAITLSQKALALAQEALAEHTTRTQETNSPPPRAGEEFRIVPKPIYDLYTLERTVNALINDERKRQGMEPLELDETLSAIARRHSEDQAATNRLTTDTQKPCAYPMIRHEGLTAAGFDLAERLDNASVTFRRAAENIALLSSAKNFVYRATASITCPDPGIQEVPKTGSREARLAAVRANVARAQALLATIPNVQWVNRDWYDLDTIARRAVTGWMESEGHRANILNASYRKTGIGAAEVNTYIIITQIFLEPR